MKVLAIPEVADLLECESTPHYIYEKTWAEAATEPFCILHTSGSTGLPKPITWNHGLLGTMDAIRLLPHVDEDGGLDPWTSIWTDKSRLYSAFPFFHVRDS
jgi:long-subunit acyl-CoA synthetase (AMP-forming)